MSEQISFQLYFSEGEHAGSTREVMTVDGHQWEALKAVLATTYKGQGILDYMFQEFPIDLSREAFLHTEAEMRKLDMQAMDTEAYVALFSLDVFIRQLDDLQKSDIRFVKLD